MRAAVLAVFASFSKQFEGICDWPYLDVLGLVTTGIGNKIDSIEEAVALPWQIGKYAATRAEIESDWRRVKSLQSWAKEGGGYFAQFTRIRLTPAAIDAMVSDKLAKHDAYLSARFPEYVTWPSDGQLAVNSMAWAMGPGFRYPKCVAALHAGDFSAAAIECHMSETGNAPIHNRNVANRILFSNAARVVEQGLDPDRIYWPSRLGEALADAVHDDVDRRRDEEV